MITWAFAWVLVKLREEGCSEVTIIWGLVLLFGVSLSELAAVFYIVQGLAR